MAIIKIETLTAEDMRTKTINARSKMVAKVTEEMARAMEMAAEDGCTIAEVEFRDRKESFDYEILEKSAAEFRRLGYISDVVKSRLALWVDWDKENYEKLQARYTAIGKTYA